ncbi:MAG: hypothetical protein IPO31_16310 [Candidatus Obscuribacter sp.]|nr:hypothetical protein [Candidatus Obscuribacter sp.]
MKKLFALLIMLIALIAIPQAYAKDAAGTAKSCAKAERSCSDCAKTCDSALSYMQKKGGKYTAGKNQQIILDCIALCKASANLQARKSPNTAKLMEVCHQVCMECAKMCKDLNDPKLADCVKACEECTSCCE